MTHYGQEVRDAFFLSELIELDSSSKNGLLYTVLSNSKKEKEKNNAWSNMKLNQIQTGKKKTIGNRKSDLPQKKKRGTFLQRSFFPSLLFFAAVTLLLNQSYRHHDSSYFILFGDPVNDEL